jgi:hypothetical protein
MNQHRRDLNTNELEKIALKAKPFLEQHQNTIVYAVCAVLLVSAFVFYLSRSWGAGDPVGWDEFIQAVHGNSPDGFGQVAEKYPNRTVGQWALLGEAEIYLAQGVRSSFTDRKGALSDLKAAREKFETLLAMSHLPTNVKERGLFGLSRCLETISDGDNEQAIKAYEAFLREFPDSTYAAIAEHQIRLLKSEEGKSFYAWFAQQDPKPEDRPRPSDGLPPGHPGVDPGSLIQLPDLPDALKLPEAEGPRGSAPDFPDTDSPEGAATRPLPPPLPDENAPSGTAPPIPE